MDGGSPWPESPSLPEPMAISPLALLSEDWPLRDVLLLTFNCNLGFFERAALARVRARGARVTLVSDADVVHADPEVVRFSGRSYLDGRAICRSGGAFHPKLIVTSGEGQAAALIGSGNVSPGGWIDNAELWTLLRGSTEEGAPGMLRRVADFLDGLPDQVRFSPGVTDVLPEIAMALRAFPVNEDGPALVSSLWGPIIDQLPMQLATGPLVVATPFHDRDAEATSRLSGRLQPTAVEVLHQRHTSFDGQRLASALEAMNGSVATITDTRYHHGKLFEWETPTGRVALTGSTNASRAALLRGMDAGGNCELGLLGPVDATLRPATGEPAEPATIADREWDPGPEQKPQVPAVLFAVILEADGLRVLLRSELAESAELQHHVEGQWVRLESVPVGAAEHFVQFRLPGGSALRLLHADESTSNVIWVADLVRTGFRSVAAKRSLPSDPVEMALDPHLVTMVEHALATVRAWSAEGPGPSNMPLKAAPPEAAAKESWRDFIDSFRGEVGDEFSFFVLPHLMRAAGAEGPRTGGESVGEEREDAEEAAQEAEELEELTARLDALRRSDGMSGRLRSYRRMCEKLAELAGRPHPVLVAGTTLTVAGAALGCWKDKVELAAQLRRSLRQLAKVGTDPDLAIDAANVAAVALAVVRAQVLAITSGDELAMIYRLAGREAKGLLVHATAEGITERAAGLVAAAFGPAVTTARVLDIVASVTHPNHVALAAELLEAEHDVPCEVREKYILLTEPVEGDPWRAVLRAIGLAQEAPVVGAIATGRTGSAAGAWRAQKLVAVRRNPRVRRITLYKLTPTARISDFAGSEGLIPAQFEVGNWYDASSVPDEVEELLFEAGILLEEL